MSAYVLRIVTVAVDPDLPRAARVVALRDAADRALARAAALAGVELGPLSHDARGAPLPSAGWHRSLAHTRGLACAALAPAPLGIDVERLDRPRADELLARTLAPAEREFLGTADGAELIALWTAKEAVLKRAGCGIGELGDCRLAAAPAAVRHAALPVRVFPIRHRGAVRPVRVACIAGHALAADLELPGFDLVLDRALSAVGAEA